MSLQDRADSYNRCFADRPGSWLTVFTADDGTQVLRGEWLFGQDYRNKSEYYGAYPGDFLERVSAVFPDHVLQPGMLPLSVTRVLHAFSGSLPPGPYDRCDITQNAEFMCDVREMPAHVGFVEPYDFALADPPYSDEDAEKYKAPPIDRGGCMNALAQLVRPSGMAGWLDTAWPMHSREQWVTVGRIYVVRSTNHRVRLFSIFERVDKEGAA